MCSTFYQASLCPGETVYMQSVSHADRDEQLHNSLTSGPYPVSLNFEAHPAQANLVRLNFVETRLLTVVHDALITDCLCFRACAADLAGRLLLLRRRSRYRCHCGFLGAGAPKWHWHDAGERARGTEAGGSGTWKKETPTLRTHQEAGDSPFCGWDACIHACEPSVEALDSRWHFLFSTHTPRAHRLAAAQPDSLGIAWQTRTRHPLPRPATSTSAR